MEVWGCLRIRTRVRRRTWVTVYLGTEVEVVEGVGACLGMQRISSSNGNLQSVVVSLVVPPSLLNSQLLVVVGSVMRPTRNSQLQVAVSLAVPQARSSRL